MFNVAVINLKTFVKYIIKIIIAVFISAMIFVFLLKKTTSTGYNFSLVYLGIISDNLVISSIHEEENEGLGAEKILGSQFAILGKINKVQNKSLDEDIEDVTQIAEGAIVENEDNKPEIQIGEVEKLPTQVIEENNKKDVFNNTYGSVKIRNESKYDLTEEMMQPFVDFNNKQDILIFHTHTCESYTPTANFNYTATGTFRTTDLNFTVAHVGETLSAYLKGKGYNVTHDQTYHDYPAYTGSYNRSYSTVKNLLSGGWTEFVIDLHRDALGSSSSYAPTVKIGEEIGAQLMFVIGTDGGGLEHPNWLNNFKLAVKIQEKANELYPRTF